LLSSRDNPCSTVRLSIPPSTLTVANKCFRALKYHFSSLEPDDRGLNQARGLACEIVAWRFLSELSERDAIDLLLFELPPITPDQDETDDEESNTNGSTRPATSRQNTSDERTALLAKKSLERRRKALSSVSNLGTYTFEAGPGISDDELSAPFAGLNALEIAVVGESKKFLSQRSVQKVLTGIWSGKIVFWESLSVHTVKKAHLYNKRFGFVFLHDSHQRNSSY
jgi:hypothetical protein